LDDDSTILERAFDAFNKQFGTEEKK